MKRSLTRMAIVLIAFNAGLAVAILALGEMGETEGRILGTSLLATFSALLAMVQVPAFQAGRLGPVPPVGMAACAVGFMMITVAIWADIDLDAWGRLGGSAYVIGAGGAVAGVLSGWPIRGKARWVGVAANVLVAVAVVMILGEIWFEVDSEASRRSFAAIAVLLSASALAVPILHRASQDRITEPIEHCPFCGARLDAEAGQSVVCADCAHTFRVRVET